MPEVPVAVTELGPGEIESIFAGWGEPRFRARQLLSWVYERGVLDLAAMTNLPRALRDRLAAELPAVRSRVAAWHGSPDGTEKALVELADGQRIESVLIPEADRATLCVSTQVGCAVRCRFCASGLEGLVRNLTSGEIVEQFLHARERLGERPLTNLVVMGMGEPLHNAEALIRALHVLNAEWGPRFGARRITVSTSGVLRGIARLAEEDAQWNLALSLHAPNDEVRAELIPHRGVGSVDEILQAGRDYARAKHRRVTIEYVLLAGVNDRPAHATELAANLAGSGFHVNLIPYNPVAGLGYHSPEPRDVDEFARLLETGGTAVTVRRQRGDQIAAACGQLRLVAAR